MPQRKIANIEKIKATATDLPDLTAQQFEFLRWVLEGCTNTEAYRRAYPTVMEGNSLWVSACKMRDNPKFKAWLAAARQAHLGTAVISKENHLRELERLKEIAVETGNVGAAVQAEQLRGKVQGYHVERYEDVTPPDVLATLEFIRRLNPELARSLASQYGLNLIEKPAGERIALPVHDQPPQAAVRSKDS